jgi:dihydroorotate dehydrogenase
LSLVHDLAARGLKRLEPERAHDLTLALLKTGLGPHVRNDAEPILATRLAGLDLPSCIGLAAGFDKNAEVPDAMLRAGLGFVECGTVTPLPQAGNPKPRLFRLMEDGAVINRMGFNNRGLDAFARRLDARPRRGVVGANIGANKDSADRIGDYVTGLERLWGRSDYFTVNISSPNTPGLRALQTREALRELLDRLNAARDRLRSGGGDYPVFLKVAPDLDDHEIEAIAETAIGHRLDAIIVSNTTTSRPDSLASAHRGEMGGLSGAPLMGLSTTVLGHFQEIAAGRIALIGAGGIASGADAYAKIRAGASAVQLYSALALKGAGLIGAVTRDLAARLKADGFRSVGEAAGAR